MGGKKGAADPKAEAERKKYLIEKKAQKEADKTFGLKNKNKSKVVQQCEPALPCGLSCMRCWDPTPLLIRVAARL